MVTPNQATALLDRVLVDATGKKVGIVAQVYLDDQTGQPSWIAVRTGSAGTHDSLVPLELVDTAEPLLCTSLNKATIAAAPRYDAEQPLARSDEDTLYGHYGLLRANTAGPTNNLPTGREYTPSGREPDSEQTGTGSGPGRPVSTRRGDAPDAPPQLRKHVVTERQTVTVPVTHEVPRIERIPISEADRDTVDPGDFTEQEYAVVLHAERPVVTTEVVVVEGDRVIDNPATVSEQTTDVPGRFHQ